MPHDGLNLGQLSFSSSHTPRASARRRPKRTPVRTGPLNAAVGPMFQLVAGQVERPLQARSSVPTTLFSSVAHAGAFAGVFLLVSMSEQIALPTPQETTHLVTLLAAMPPPDLALSLAKLPKETPPEPYFAPPPSLNVGLGSGFGSGSEEGSGSGFGVEGGVGWGQGTSSPGREPIRVGGGVTTPELVHRVEPAYPPDAVADRIEGTVVVEATVDEQGHVEAVRVLRSIGPLDQAAIDAVMRWRYSPLRVNDQPARFILTVNVTFRLH